MKRVCKAYREVLRILFSANPFIVIITFISALATGLLALLALWVNSQVFNMGLAVATGDASMDSYTPYLGLFALVALLPILIGDLLIRSYVMPYCRLVLRTAYKGQLLEKLKKLRYEHLEKETDREIIDKTYHQVEDAFLSLFPQATWQMIMAGITSVGILIILGRIKWQILPVMLMPFIWETWFTERTNREIYDEMDGYWKKEKSYEVLGKMLRSRDYIKENHLMGAGDFLVNTYKRRMRRRNQEYENFFLRHLRQNFLKRNLTWIGQLVGAGMLFFLYRGGELSIGTFVSLTNAIIISLFSQNGLVGFVETVRTSGKYARAFDYYDRYLALSEDMDGNYDQLPENVEIEFDHVCFTYPGASCPILNDMSFCIRHGERISLVGANGEGKTTIVKLLLGLFAPDSGQIWIGGREISSYSQRARIHMFGPVFQDFEKYNITLAENVGVGGIEWLNDEAAVDTAMEKAGVNSVAELLANGKNTLLGNRFENGVDLSGGQWQRVAIARAFMGDKPVLILDEPTGELDPMAESRLLSEFVELSKGKTAIFISHRLASVAVTDRILVVSGGKIVQSGSHSELLKQNGLYASMYAAQEQWYVRGEEEEKAVHGRK
ncbi:MAG: ABC transporter ATP-binding protein [Lachnospiraceae bacterium]|nr:ABC transporter ATP-binding protein [Lachnospiraceae bacterium]